MKTLKSVLIVAFGLFAIILSTNAQVIHFNCINLFDSTAVVPDSIRIVNLTQNRTVVVRNANDFNLFFFTGINEQETPRSDIIFNFEGFSLYSDDDQTANETITDLCGNIVVSKKLLISKGYNNFDFDLKNFADGFYLLNLVIGTSTKTYKILKLESRNSSLGRLNVVYGKGINPQIQNTLINTTDKYSFYAYWKRSKDSVLNKGITGDTTINFKFFFNGSNYTFTKGEFKLIGLITEQEDTFINYYTPDNPSKSYSYTIDSGTIYSYIFIDSILYDARDMFFDVTGCRYCNGKKNNQTDSVEFCYEGYNYSSFSGDDDYGTDRECINKTMDCSLDTIKNIITGLYVSFSEGRRIQSTCLNVTDTEDESLMFQNIPYVIKPDGTIQCNLGSNDILQCIVPNKIKYSTYNLRTNRCGVPMNEDYTNFYKLLGVNSDASLSFVLYP